MKAISPPSQAPPCFYTEQVKRIPGPMAQALTFSRPGDSGSLSLSVEIRRAPEAVEEVLHGQGNAQLAWI